MSRLRLREIPADERLLAAERVRSWGFPRLVHLDELLCAHWFEWGPLGVFWLVPDFGVTRELAVHIAIAPGAWLTRRAAEWEGILRVLADLLAADAVYACPIQGTASGRAVASLVRARGWTQEGPRWYLSLDGSQEEAGPRSAPSAEGVGS